MKRGYLSLTVWCHGYGDWRVGFDSTLGPFLAWCPTEDAARAAFRLLNEAAPSGSEAPR